MSYCTILYYIYSISDKNNFYIKDKQRSHPLPPLPPSLTSPPSSSSQHGSSRGAGQELGGQTGRTYTHENSLQASEQVWAGEQRLEASSIMALIPSQVLRIAILLSYFSILCHYKALDMPAHQTYGGSWKFLTFIDLVRPSVLFVHPPNNPR